MTPAAHVTVNRAIGRIFGMMQRPEQRPSFIADYQKPPPVRMEEASGWRSGPG